MHRSIMPDRWINCGIAWSGRLDLNQRPPAPKAALVQGVYQGFVRNVWSAGQPLVALRWFVGLVVVAVAFGPVSLVHCQSVSTESGPDGPSTRVANRWPMRT